MDSRLRGNDKRQQTLIEWACSNKKSDFLPLILELSPNFKDKKNTSAQNALKIAIKNSNVELVRILLNYGMDLNFRFEVQAKSNAESDAESDAELDDEMHSPLTLAESIWDDASSREEIIRLLEKKYYEVFKENIKNNPMKEINSQNIHDDCALHCAVRFKDIEFIKTLLTLGANPNLINDIKRCPLSLACDSQEKDLIEILLQFNPSLHAETSFNEPLSILCRLGNLELVQIFCEKYPMIFENQTEEIYTGALKTACAYGHIQIVRYLIDKYSSKPPFPIMSLAILSACQNNKIKIVQLLIDDYKFKFISEEQHHRLHNFFIAPLSLACHHNNLELAKILVKVGANVNSKLTSPLAQACLNMNIEMIQFLIEECKIDPNLKSLGRRNYHCDHVWDDLNYHAKNAIPILAACSTGNMYIVQYLLKQGASLNGTMTQVFPHPIYTVELNMVSFGFYKACVQGHMNVAEELLKFKPNLNFKNTFDADQPSAYELALKLAKEKNNDYFLIKVEERAREQTHE